MGSYPLSRRFEYDLPLTKAAGRGQVRFWKVGVDRFGEIYSTAGGVISQICISDSPEPNVLCWRDYAGWLSGSHIGIRVVLPRSRVTAW